MKRVSVEPWVADCAEAPGQAPRSWSCRAVVEASFSVPRSLPLTASSLPQWPCGRIIYHCNHAIACDHPTLFSLWTPWHELAFPPSGPPSQAASLQICSPPSRTADRSSVTLPSHSLEFPHETLLEIEVQLETRGCQPAPEFSSPMQKGTLSPEGD